ncbi:hypothetical protein BGZ76_009124 [Entomortierella beljakovae]|nr:hypothetical protein BGZ76_009124 [Entomortierella beljakovae]
MPAPAYTPVPIAPHRLPPPHHTPKPTPSFPLPSISQSPYYSLGLGFIRKFREERLSSIRPFTEFLDINRFSKPDGIATIASRLGYNLTYFQSNYMVVFLGISAWNVINNVMLVFSVGFVYGGASAVTILGHAAFMQETVENNISEVV